MQVVPLPAYRGVPSPEYGLCASLSVCVFAEVANATLPHDEYGSGASATLPCDEYGNRANATLPRDENCSQAHATQTNDQFVF